MSYLMAQDTLNGAEGKITITRNGRILEAAGMRNIKTIAGIQTSDMKTIGTRKVQKKANGVTQTGTGNVYFGSNGSNLFIDITITNQDPTSSVGAQVMGYYGCVLTGDIPLSILDDEEAMLSYDFNFSYTSVKRLEAFNDPANLGSN